MGPLTSMACSPGFLSTRPRGIFCVGRALRLPTAGLRMPARFATVFGIFCHLSRLCVAALIGRLRLQRGFAIFTSVEGHDMYMAGVSPVEGRTGLYPLGSPSPDFPRYQELHVSGGASCFLPLGLWKGSSPARMTTVRLLLGQHSFPA